MQAIGPLAVILVAAFSDGGQHINTIVGGSDRDELVAWLNNTARHERRERRAPTAFNCLILQRIHGRLRNFPA
jgi:hypothetical protein